MKKFFKSLTVALFVSIGLHILYFLFMFLLNQLNETEIQETKEILPLSLSLFFFPIFSAYYFFKKENKNHTNILISGIASIILCGFFEIVFFTFFENRPNFSFFDVVFLEL